MFEEMKDEYKIAFIRGATTASGNSVEEMEEVVVGLKLLKSNLKPRCIQMMILINVKAQTMLFQRASVIFQLNL